MTRKPSRRLTMIARNPNHTILVRSDPRGCYVGSVLTEDRIEAALKGGRVLLRFGHPDQEPVMSPMAVQDLVRPYLDAPKTAVVAAAERASGRTQPGDPRRIEFYLRHAFAN